MTEYETELCALLHWYKSQFPAFRSKPIGAPNSSKRAEQDQHIIMEDRANAALTNPPKNNGPSKGDDNYNKPCRYFVMQHERADMNRLGMMVEILDEMDDPAERVAIMNYINARYKRV